MSLPQYPKYKDSGVEWLGEVPEHWPISRLGFESWVRARLGWKGLKADEYVDDGYIFLSTPNIKETGIDFENVNYITEDRYEESPEIRLRVGDVVLAKDGSTLGTVNVVRFLPRPATVNSSIAVITPQTSLDGVFLYYLFQSSFVKATIQRIKGGMGVPHLFQADLTKFYMPAPPVYEQKQIATFLDLETIKIDALVEEQRRLIELLKEKRQAVISHAVTKGLNPDAPMKDSGIECIGEIPAHWEVVRLKFLAHVQGGIAKGRDLGAAETIHVPYLRVANVQDGYLDLEEVTLIDILPGELERYSLQPGDVLMNEGGDFDKLGRGHIWRGEIEPCIHQNHVFAVRPEMLEPEWLNLITSAECGRFYFMSRSKQSTNLASISSSNIQELPVVCPPTAERLAIVKHVRVATNSFDQLITEATHAINLLQERRTALISAAVTGEIDVRATAASAAVAAKSYSTGFARQLLAAEILLHCHAHPTTGRVKLQKLIHLCEYVAEIDEVHANYKREAAGPFDNKLMFGIASGLSRQKWFAEERNRDHTCYRPLEKAGGHRKYLARWESKIPKVQLVLQLLGEAKTQQCEIVSTLYAAWNDLLIEGRSPSDAEIIHEASDAERWHENKALISPDKWPKALQWMREKGLIPRGYGSHTRGGHASETIQVGSRKTPKRETE
jgi:type I restriction enzyme S subunit